MGMPHILIDPFTRILFTVDSTVGRSAPNERLDVLLVQYLLFLCTKNGMSVPPLTVPRGLRVATPVAAATTGTLTHPKPPGDIVIDGICGNQTIGFIEYFQEVTQRNPVASIVVNGQVVPQGTPGTYIGTMYMLNKTVTELTQLSKFYQSAAFPQELKSSFYF
jgi:hypothetical protein